MLDLIIIPVALIMIFFIIGIFLIIMYKPKFNKEQYYEDQEQMEYLRKYDNEKRLKK